MHLVTWPVTQRPQVQNQPFPLATLASLKPHYDILLSLGVLLLRLI